MSKLQAGLSKPNGKPNDKPDAGQHLDELSPARGSACAVARSKEPASVAPAQGPGHTARGDAVRRVGSCADCGREFSADDIQLIKRLIEQARPSNTHPCRASCASCGAGPKPTVSLSPRPVRDLRGIPAPSRHLPPGRQLGKRRPDHWERQEIRRPPADHPHQGHLALPTAQGFRQPTLSVAAPSTHGQRGNADNAPSVRSRAVRWAAELRVAAGLQAAVAACSGRYPAQCQAPPGLRQPAWQRGPRVIDDTAAVSLLAGVPDQRHAGALRAPGQQHAHGAGLGGATHAAAVAGLAWCWLGGRQRVQPNNTRFHQHRSICCAPLGCRQNSSLEGAQLRRNGDTIAMLECWLNQIRSFPSPCWQFDRQQGGSLVRQPVQPGRGRFFQTHQRAGNRRLR